MQNVKVNAAKPSLNKSLHSTFTFISFIKFFKWSL